MKVGVNFFLQFSNVVLDILGLQPANIYRLCKFGKPVFFDSKFHENTQVLMEKTQVSPNFCRVVYFFLIFVFPLNSEYRIATEKENLWTEKEKTKKTAAIQHKAGEKKYKQFKKAIICTAMCTYFYICNAYFISASIVFCILLCCWIIRQYFFF